SLATARPTSRLCAASGCGSRLTTCSASVRQCPHGRRRPRPHARKTARAHPWTPSPAQALAKDDPAQPWAECGCLPQAFPALPGDHKGLLDSIFGGAEIMEDKVRVLEHRAGVLPQGRLESWIIELLPRLFCHHSGHPIRGLGGPEKFGWLF